MRRLSTRAHTYEEDGSICAGHFESSQQPHSLLPLKGGYSPPFHGRAYMMYLQRLPTYGSLFYIVAIFIVIFSIYFPFLDNSV